MSQINSPQSGAGHRLGLLMVTGAAVAWSTAGFFVRLIALDSWTMLVWRGFFAALGLLAVIAARDRSRIWLGFARLGWQGLAYAALATFGMTVFILALDHTSVAHVAVIYATAPFLAAALGWIFGREHPSAKAMAASCAALTGVGVMAGFAPEGGLLGDCLALAMTMAMAGLIVLARRRPDIETLPASCLACALTALVSLPFAAGIVPSGPLVAELALFGIINSALGIALFMIGSRLLPPIESALISALDAPLAPLLVWLAFGEKPTMPTLIGGGIVFAAVTAHILSGFSREASATACSRNSPP